MTVVLMYHGVGHSPAQRGELRYTVARKQFEVQLEHLAQAHRVVSFADVAAGRAGEGAVAVTFDDGEASVFEHALPVMRRLGLTGTAFVTTGWIGQPGYLGADELRELDRLGWTVGAHGVTHRYLSALDDPDLDDELLQSRDALTLILGRAPEQMSLPGGRADRRVVAAVRRAGYRSLGTSELGPNSAAPDPFGVKRAMVLRHWDDRRFTGLAKGCPALYRRLRARQLALDTGKRLLGNRGYDLLRRGALEILRRG